MKLKEQISKTFSGFIAFCILQFAIPVLADTGHEGAVRTERGSYADTFKVTGSSTTGTNIFSVKTKRADGTCFNNTSSTVWVSTNATTQHNTTHSNITFGIPVLSSSTFPLDGNFTGSLAMTCDIGVASCEFRCLEGLVQ